MKINEQCLACLVNQAVKTANLVNAENREELYKHIFASMSNMDFSKTNPEIVGENYRLIKKHTGYDDPYKETKQYYNRLFSEQMQVYEEKIHSLEEAVKYAIVANIIDFNPVHSNVEENIKQYFANIDNLILTINDVASLINDIQRAKTMLYLGDNCGEICFDKLLIKKIRALNPECRIYFGVRGEAVVNDNTEEDAYFVGMDEVATIISNGDCSLGTILSRTNTEFQKVYREADVVIAKGQANYESLSEEKKNIYFLLMTKCKVIAEDIGVKEKSLVCMKNNNTEVIARIQQMEQYMDEVSEVLKSSPVAIKEDAELCKKIELLTEYMDSGQWLRDYEADEQGELPAGLKRGVLSQDGLYNLLSEVKKIINQKIVFKEVDKTYFEVYDKIPMKVDVCTEYRIKRLDNGLGGLILEEVPVEPYAKDLGKYECATTYEEQFDISNWRFYMAFDGENAIGAVTVAGPTKGMNMLYGREDACVLWDIRVADGYKQQGIGQTLLDMGIAGAKERGYRQMIIECQNNNVPACNFYHKQGAVLCKVDLHAYYMEPKVRDEVQLVWYLDI